MLQNLEQIHPQAKMWIEPLLQAICGECKESVDSIYLYGSVVTEDYLPKESQIQSLILFDQFHFPRAKQLQPFVKKHLKNGVIAPLCLSIETFERSTDTFPLELIEIKEKHLHIYGESNRALDIDIPTENLRIKIEEQIKGKLIRLREIYMETGDHPKQLLEILIHAIDGLIPVFRNLLKFLQDSEPPKTTSEVLQVLDQKTEFSVTVLQTVWDHHQKIRPIPKDRVLDTYSNMADVLLELSNLIDSKQKTS